jgi:hypothetical protein
MLEMYKLLSPPSEMIHISGSLEGGGGEAFIQVSIEQSIMRI